MSSLFRTQSRDPGSSARTGILTTAHGQVATPAFVAVATQATVKALEPQTLVELGVQIVIANSYHLHLRPGEDIIAGLGGLHGFSGWDGPVMTDSGGFQVFSLGAGKEHGVGKIASIFPGGSSCIPAEGHQGRKSLVRLDEEGVRFRSIVDGSEHLFSPETVITLQRKLGADIVLVLDECTSPLHSYSYTKRAMERTHRWAKRGLEAFREGAKGEMSPNPGQVLYGIVQGGAYKALRQESAQRIEEIGFEGFAIGGSLGRSKEEMHLVLDWTVPYLGVEKPRHLLGIGEIDDIFAAVGRGVDTFDCAAPTRIARNGTVFVKDAPRHRINLRNARFKSDPNPIASHCDCFTCRHHSRAYLRHLCRSGELSFYRLASMHNLRFIVCLMSDIRAAITAGRLSELEQEWQTAKGDGSA